ncbi:hypothetical protein SDC9_84621 [bioreactor metagenome]|uniref:Uncharacterized protein n=1 Tax=bioreactor metagenome TaxID=1076179 RepID=A0A644ZCH7_9ZZZZ
MVFPGHRGQRVGDRRGVQADLQQPRQNVRHIAVLDHDGRGGQADPQTEAQDHQDPEGDQEHRPPRVHAIGDEQDDAEHERDGEVQEHREERRQRHQHPREEDLRHQRLIADHRARRPADDAAEEGPGEHADEAEQEVRHAVAGELGDVAEDDREDAGRRQRLQQHPGDPDGRLAVAQHDIALTEPVGDLAGLPQLARVGEVEPARRGDDRTGHASLLS